MGYLSAALAGDLHKTRAQGGIDSETGWPPQGVHTILAIWIGLYLQDQDPNSLERFASGSGDGVVKVWDFTSREEKWQAQAHQNMVKGMCWTRDKRLITCGADKQVQMFEQEASAMLRATQDQLAALRTAEASLLEIGALQSELAHHLTQDDHYQGYHLPKGAVIWANIW